MLGKQRLHLQATPVSALAEQAAGEDFSNYMRRPVSPSDLHANLLCRVDPSKPGAAAIQAASRLAGKSLVRRTCCSRSA